MYIITYKKHGELVCNTEVVVDKEVEVVEVTKKNLGSLNVFQMLNN